MNETATDVTLGVIAVLDSLGIRYLIGGSLACAVYGKARSTLDSDIVADIDVSHIQPLMDLLGGNFYISADSVRGALAHRTSFNLIHFETGFKVDIFLPKNRSFDVHEFDHRNHVAIAFEPERKAYMASAEDIILAKLDWYRQGHEVSERQWLDIRGIIEVQGHRLDVNYLRQGAAELKVLDLLELALEIIS